MGCTWKQRDDSIIWYNNYSIPETLIIEAGSPFLTDYQFNKSVLDTTKMLKLDRNISIEFKKTIFRFESDSSDITLSEDGKELYSGLDPEDSRWSYFCMGKLNLQPDISSLVILESSCLLPKIDNWNNLWLFNTKNDQICSIVLLFSIFKINTSTFSSICVNNKIFTKCKNVEDYYFYKNFGQLFKKNKEIFSTFTINENGHVVFTKDKYFKVPCSR